MGSIVLTAAHGEGHSSHSESFGSHVGSAPSGDGIRLNGPVGTVVIVVLVLFLVIRFFVRHWNRED